MKGVLDELVVEVLVDLDDGRAVATAVAVVGRTEDRHHRLQVRHSWCPNAVYTNTTSCTDHAYIHTCAIDVRPRASTGSHR